MYYQIKRKIEEYLQAVKYAYQRVVRGFDDNAMWNLDDHLAKQIPEILTKMYDKGNSYPTGITRDEWELILLDISIGFDSYYRLRNSEDELSKKEEKQLRKNYQQGMKLFVKWYEDLWD